MSVDINERRLFLVEANVTATDYDYEGYGEPELRLSTREIDVKDLFKEEWFTQMLEENGWADQKKVAKMAGKLAYGSRFFALRDYGNNSLNGVKINIENATADHIRYLLTKGIVIAQEIDLDSLKNVNPTLAKQIEKVIQSQKRAEKTAAERERARLEAKRIKDEAKKAKKLADAKKLLVENGIEIKEGK